MRNRATIVEALARADVPPAFAESATRNLAEDGIIRRAPPGRPRKNDPLFAYDDDELAAIVLTLTAPAPADVVGMLRVLAELHPDPEETTLGVIDADLTPRAWLAEIFKNLAELSAEARKAAYRQSRGAFIEFITDPNDIGSAAAATVRAEWGPSDDRSRILFKSADVSLAEITSEAPRRYQTTFIVHLEWALLLDLTAPPKELEPENESAGTLPGVPVPIDQPITEPNSAEQPTGASNTPTVAESERAPKR